VDVALAIRSHTTERYFTYNSLDLESWPPSKEQIVSHYPSFVLLSTNYVNAPFRKGIKALLWIFLIIVQVPFNESFQLSEELFNLD
jgi:hypothetical protein